MSDNNQLAVFGMALIVLCILLAGLLAKTQGDRKQLLTQLRQCEARNE